MSSTSKPFSGFYLLWISREWSAEDRGTLEYELSLNELEHELANRRQAKYDADQIKSPLGTALYQLLVDFWTEAV